MPEMILMLYKGLICYLCKWYEARFKYETGCHIAVLIHMSTLFTLLYKHWRLWGWFNAMTKISSFKRPRSTSNPCHFSCVDRYMTMGKQNSGNISTATPQIIDPVNRARHQWWQRLWRINHTIANQISFDQFWYYRHWNDYFLSSFLLFMITQRTFIFSYFVMS